MGLEIKTTQSTIHKAQRQQQESNEPKLYTNNNVDDDDKYSKIIDTMKKEKTGADDDNDEARGDKIDDDDDESVSSFTSSTGFTEMPPELMTMIMEHLDTVSVLKCRQINSQWKDCASMMIHRRKHIEITFSPSFMTVWQSIPVYDDALGKFRMMNKCLENGSLLSSDNLDQFPCTQFRLDNVDIGGDEVQKFFSFFGRFIKSLTLTSCTSCQDLNELSTLRKLLVSQAPNIETLRIQYYIIPTSLHEQLGQSGGVCRPSISLLKLNTENPPLNLPKLHTLHCGWKEWENGLGGEILEAAVNLHVYENFDPQVNLRKFVQAGKLDTIKNLSLQLKQTNIQFWERFVCTKPKLINLSFAFSYCIYQSQDPIFRARVGQLITKFLEYSADTLENITLLPIGCFEGVQIPVFKKLRKLTMKNDTEASSPPSVVGNLPIKKPMFPPVRGCLADKFRTLNTVIFHFFYYGSAATWTTYFPYFEPLPSVKHLKTNYLPESDLKMVSLMFPHLVKTLVPISCHQHHDHEDL